MNEGVNMLEASTNQGMLGANNETLLKKVILKLVSSTSKYRRLD